MEFATVLRLGVCTAVDDCRACEFVVFGVEVATGADVGRGREPPSPLVLLLKSA